MWAGLGAREAPEEEMYATMVRVYNFERNYYDYDEMIKETGCWWRTRPAAGTQAYNHKHYLYTDPQVRPAKHKFDDTVPTAAN